jgi:putative peptidoglycan lipid II flippase
VLGIALGTVLLPEMSSRLAVNDAEGSHSAQNRTVALSLLLTLPFAAVFIAIPDTIMRAIFAHGAFDSSAAALSAIALATYGVGLPAFALTRIVQATFYARHDTATPVRITLGALACNIALKFVFVWGLHLGIAGIALGTSFGAWINVAALTVMGRRRGLLQFDADFLRSLVPIFLAAAVTAAAAYGAVYFGGAVLHDVKFLQVILLAAAIVAGGICYGLIVLIFRNRLPLGRFARV